MQENKDFCQQEVNQDLSRWKMTGAKSATYIPEIRRAHVFLNCRGPAVLQAPVHAEPQSRSALQLFNMQGLFEHPQIQPTVRLRAQMSPTRVETHSKLCRFLVFLMALMWVCEQVCVSENAQKQNNW